jgi:GNAT superfamily N-acetyltransferase
MGAMKPTLSPALPGDAADVAAVVEAAYAPYVARIGTKPGPMLDDYDAVIARHIVRVVRAEAARRGYARLDLYTHEMMTENIEIYRRRGFVETDRRTERGFPRVYMAKDLTGGCPP